MEDEIIGGGAPSRPASKAELLARISAAWSDLQTIIEPLSSEQLAEHSTGSWSVKDHLAHLAFWEQLMLRSILGNEPPEIVLAVDPVTFEALDETGINELVERRSRDLPVADVMAASQQSHAQVVRYLDAVPFETLLQPRDPNDPEKRPLLDWVAGNTYDHYWEHAGWIAEQLEQQRSAG